MYTFRRCQAVATAIDGAQIRAARRSYPLERRRPRRPCGRDERRAELTTTETSLTSANDRAIRRTLEAAGVEFIDANGGGPGVRLQRAEEAHADAGSNNGFEPRGAKVNDPLLAQLRPRLVRRQLGAPAPSDSVPDRACYTVTRISVLTVI